MKKFGVLPTAFALCVCAALVFVNLDGYHLHLAAFPATSRNPNFKSSSRFEGPGDFSAESPYINWVHGWPIASFIRPGHYSVGRRGQFPLATSSGPREDYSRWPFDDAPIEFYSMSALVLDGLLMFGSTGGAYLVTRRLMRRFKISDSYSLASLLALMTAIAPVIAFRSYIFNNRYILEALAFMVAVCGVIMLAVECSIRLYQIVSFRRDAEPSDAAERRS